MPNLTQGLLNLLPPSDIDNPVFYNLLQLAERSTANTYPPSHWQRFRSRAMSLGSLRRATGMDSSMHDPPIQSVEEGLPFFAAVCGALALGALELACENHRRSDDMASVPIHAPDASYWYALSAQALSVYESGFSSSGSATEYNLEYLTACLLQTVFLIRGGAVVDFGVPGSESIVEASTSSAKVEGVVFPLVFLIH